MDSSSSPVAVTARHQHRQGERLDNLVDGAFAFAITLMVISGSNLPHSVGDLVQALRGIPALAVCFLQLAWFWHGHVRWRERSVQTNRGGLFLSLLLVFFALIFVFPLHLVYASLFNGLSGGVLSPGYEVMAPNVGLYQVKVLFVCYGLCNACMGGTLAILLGSSVRGRTEADRSEAFDARIDTVMWTFATLVSLLSMLLALIAINNMMMQLAGYSYMLLALTGIVMTFYRRHLEKRLTASDKVS